MLRFDCILRGCESVSTAPPQVNDEDQKGAQKGILLARLP
jgi:hypothetical protein